MLRVIDGTLKTGDKVQFMATGRIYQVDELGVFTPKPTTVVQLSVGEVGFLYAGIKDLIQAQIGDTVTLASRPTASAFPGFQEVKPMVFAGLYPVSADDLRGPARRGRQAAPERRLVHLRAGELGRARLRLPLRLPRPAPHGDHPGAPGARVRPRPDHHRPGRALHAPTPPTATRSRSTARPSCRRLASSTTSRSRTSRRRSSPAPISWAAILQLAEERRGEQQSLQYLTTDRVLIEYEFPLAEVISRLLRPAEVGLPRLRLLRLRAERLPRGVIWSSSTSWSTASRSTPCR